MKYIYIIILTLLFIGVEYAQLSTPTYTPNYGLRKYAQGANAGADSLNANWTDIDTEIKLAADSASASGKKTKTNTWTGLNTFSNIVTFSGTYIGTKSLLPSVTDVSSIGYYPNRYLSMHTKNLHVENIYISNSAENDSVKFIYNDSILTIDKEVTFQVSNILPTFASRIGDDTSAFNKVFADTVISGESFLLLQGKQGGVKIYGDYGISAPPTAAIVAATTTVNVSGVSYVRFTESEPVTAIATLTAGGTRQEGALLTVVNGSNFAVTLKNGTGNMILGADLTLGQYDVAQFIYYDIGGSSYRWLCISSRNN